MIVTLNRASRLRRIGAATVIAASLLGASGCAAINEQATTKVYDASDGYSSDLKNSSTDVELRNMMLISNGKDKPARVLGTIVNNGDKPVEVTIAFENGEKVVVKAAAEAKGEAKADAPKGPATKSTKLEDPAHKALIQKSPAIPGGETEVTISADGVEEKATLPVLDGALKQYREYLPGGYTPSPSASEHSDKKEGEAKH